MKAIFGAHGYCGTDLCKRLNQDKTPYVAFSRRGFNFFNIFRNKNEFGYRLNKYLEIRKIIDNTGIDSITFLSSPRILDMQQTMQHFIGPFYAFIHNLPEIPFIYASSQIIYGKQNNSTIDENCKLQPVSPYQFEKVICEDILVHSNKVLPAIFRIPIALSENPGPSKQQLIPDVVDCALKGISFYFKQSKEESMNLPCSWLHTADLADRIVRILKMKPFPQGIYNIASGVFKFHDLVEFIIKKTGSNSKIYYAGNSIDKSIVDKSYIVPSSTYSLDTSKLDSIIKQSNDYEWEKTVATIIEAKR
jgi:nucleoside-diphosphate-sugar epimerase